MWIAPGLGTEKIQISSHVPCTSLPRTFPTISGSGLWEIYNEDGTQADPARKQKLNEW